MMRFRGIGEQVELVESFTRPAETLLPLGRLREGHSPDGALWSQIAELGWLGISLGEAHGGIGLGPVEEALAAETMGRHLLTPGYLATVIGARVAVSNGSDEIARSFADGTSRVALGLSAAGAGRTVVDAEGCGFALFLSGDTITLHAITSVSDIDTEHWALPVQSATPGDAVATSSNQGDLAFARLLAAATLAGIATQSGELAVDYAKVREQFGQPIGAFQAVKHHCANMAISAYGARELVRRAAMALEDGDDEGSTLAAMALNFASRAARQNAGLSIQVHGGMGFSAEADPHNFLKYGHLVEAAFGGSEAIRRLLLVWAPRL